MLLSKVLGQLEFDKWGVKKIKIKIYSLAGGKQRQVMLKWLGFVSLPEEKLRFWTATGRARFI